jgi:hypothetical protein
MKIASEREVRREKKTLAFLLQGMFLGLWPSQLAPPTSEPNNPIYRV